MADPRPRAALLARPGVACERLQAALQEAGADVVLVVDPLESAPEDLVAAQAQAVLVVLEPSVESALENFETVLADPATTVIFDEAELAATREGWDAARWVRHLAAKLHRHTDVLPPGTESELEPEPELGMDIEAGRLSLYQRPEGDGDLTGVADEAEGMAGSVPRDSLDVTDAVSFDPVAAESGTTLVDLDEAIAMSTDDDAALSQRFHQDINDLEQRTSNLTLMDTPRNTAESQGAVVILAGIGGPDAVRQLLGGLPTRFPRAVVIQQRLDGARHDKLVRQMQRATEMPVALAEIGKDIEPGHVYILPPEISIAAGEKGPAFALDDGAAAFVGLPASDTAIILLSGSDAEAVDAAMTHAAHGALVVGQSPEGCYDATATQVLVARGAETGSPANLAKLLASRWPAPREHNK